jgi:hypothetical protein
MPATADHRAGDDDQVAAVQVDEGLALFGLHLAGLGELLRVAKDRFRVVHDERGDLARICSASSTGNAAGVPLIIHSSPTGTIPPIMIVPGVRALMPSGPCWTVSGR